MNQLSGILWHTSPAPVNPKINLWTETNLLNSCQVYGTCEREAQRHKGREAQRHKGTKAQRKRGIKAQRHKGILDSWSGPGMTFFRPVTKTPRHQGDSWRNWQLITDNWKLNTDNWKPITGAKAFWIPGRFPVRLDGAKKPRFFIAFCLELRYPFPVVFLQVGSVGLVKNLILPTEIYYLYPKSTWIRS